MERERDSEGELEKGSRGGEEAQASEAQGGAPARAETHAPAPYDSPLRVLADGPTPPSTERRRSCARCLAFLRESRHRAYSSMLGVPMHRTWTSVSGASCRWWLMVMV